VDRRDFVKSLLVVGATDAHAVHQSAGSDPDYVVVGSGAGGGTVAARLAEEGFSVVVLEAGGDARLAAPDHYDVPAFHPFATEDPALSWDFFVRHYRNDEQQQRDPKFVVEQDGVWYPRAGTLGGCTAHNAMILLVPSNSDWDQIADVTGDPSWRAPAMRKYFQRLEDCHHRPYERFWQVFGLNPSRHGWAGWLQTENPVPLDAIADEQVRRILVRSVDSNREEFG